MLYICKASNKFNLNHATRVSHNTLTITNRNNSYCSTVQGAKASTVTFTRIITYCFCRKVL